MGQPITVRAKRGRQTYFVSGDTGDTVHALKTRLAHVLSATADSATAASGPSSSSAASKRDPRDLRLLAAAAPRPDDPPAKAPQSAPATAPSASSVNAYTPLDDSAVLEQLGLTDDAVLYFVFRLSDTLGDASWEQ
ncbi:hypothetical protein HK100_004968, partial [Physocladia obscura]